jgi:hypothetical protein
MKSLPWLSFPLSFAAGCASPIALHTYDGDVLVYPDFLPANQPTILAFLDGNDRRCDKMLKPLRGLSSRKEVYLAGVLTYEDNAFLDQISSSSKAEMVFPVLLDPRKKMVNQFGIRRYPTFVYLSPQGKEVAREYDIQKINAWYGREWVYRAFGRKYQKTDEDKADE